MKLNKITYFNWTTTTIELESPTEEDIYDLYAFNGFVHVRVTHSSPFLMTFRLYEIK